MHVDVLQELALFIQFDSRAVSQPTRVESHKGVPIFTKPPSQKSELQKLVMRPKLTGWGELVSFAPIYKVEACISSIAIGNFDATLNLVTALKLHSTGECTESTFSCWAVATGTENLRNHFETRSSFSQ